MTAKPDASPSGSAPRPAALSSDAAGRGPRRPAVLFVLALVALALFVGFAALGTWQVERRAWKLDLISRVDQRSHAAPVAVPARDAWARVNAGDDEYRRVTATGVLLNDQETLVQANTDLGPGFWVMTPLQLDDGSVVMINRGFVTAERRDPATRDPAANQAPVERRATVTGLLRMTEPGGAFLRKNDPAAGRWYSRDVQAMGVAHGQSDVAPYFVDADSATSPQTSWPIGGLTIVAFHNSHLVYAITWYTLALMVAIAAWYVRREERRLRRTKEENTLRSHG